MQSRLIELGPVVVYKVVGSEETCLEYQAGASCAARAKHMPSDWTAFYFQLNKRHALGTLGYRFDAGYKVARLLEVELRDGRQAVLFNDPAMASGEVTGHEKARLIKAQLGMRAEGNLLMEELGKRQQCLLCLETADEMELVMPLSLLATGIASERLVCEFMSNEFGVATRMRWADSAAWIGYDDKVFGANAIPEWAK